MSSNQTYTVELKERHWAWLEEMMKKHSVAYTSKTVRCLINFAIEKSEHEDAIFKEIRCGDC